MGTHVSHNEYWVVGILFSLYMHRECCTYRHMSKETMHHEYWVIDMDGPQTVVLKIQNSWCMHCGRLMSITYAHFECALRDNSKQYVRFMVHFLWEVHTLNHHAWRMHCVRFKPVIENSLWYSLEKHTWKCSHGAWTLEADTYEPVLITNVLFETQASNPAFIVYILGWALA